jgi:hypothetical protein
VRIRQSLFGSLLIGALVAVPAIADEVVYFTNGTYLLITNHSIEKEMISVDLGGNSRMAFPLQMVDKIESSGRSVYLNPTYHPANQAVAGMMGESVSGGRVFPVTGEGNVPSRYRSFHPTQGTDVPAFVDASSNARAAALAAAGYRPVPNQEGDRVADRLAAEIRSLEGGVPVPQIPQSLGGGAGRRPNLVRASPRFGATPVMVPGATNPGNGGGGQQGQAPTQNPVVDPPAEDPPQNPPPGE